MSITQSSIFRTSFITRHLSPKKQLKSLDEVDPELRQMFDKLGINLDEQKRISGVAVDAVIDSVSVATTYKKKLSEVGVIFCSFSEAVQNHPELVKNIWAQLSPTQIIITRHLILRFLAMAVFVLFLRV